MEPQAGNEATSETVKPNNLFGRLIGAITAPRATFEEIGRAPTVMGAIIAFLVVSFLMTLYLSLSGAMAAITAAQLQGLVDQGKLSEEQLRQMQTMIKPGVGQLVIGPIVSLILPLIVAGYGKLISVIAGAENTYKKLFSATLFAWTPVYVVQAVVTVLVLTLKGPETATAAGSGSMIASSLGAVISAMLGDDALPGFLMRLFGYVDLFNIWKIVLMAIGFSAVSRKLKTSTAATWLTAAYAIFALIASAASGLLSSGM